MLYQFKFKQFVTYYYILRDFLNVNYFLDAHLSLLVLDLDLMKLRDFRKEITIADDSLYSRCLQEDIISCEVKFRDSSFVFLYSLCEVVALLCLNVSTYLSL